MVLSAACVTRLSSLRSSCRFQRRLDLNSSVFDSGEPEQFLGPPVAPDVVVEEEVLQRLAEGRVVGDPLVELEVGLDDLLDLVLHLRIEGEPDVLPRVDAGAGVEAGVLVESVADLLQRHPVLGAEVEPEALVQLGDDPRERLDLLLAPAQVRLGLHRVQPAGPRVQRDGAAAGLLDPVRLHVDVLLHLARQFLAVGRQEPPQVAGEDVELFQVGVGEGQDLGQEGIQPHVVSELAPEVAPFVGFEIAEPRQARIEHPVEPVLRGPAVEVDAGERFDVRLAVDAEVE